ncbi:hypothetical protein OJ997_02920 [Solirubrobacter phytolaccae]|uniref:Uncharacterized protein n=1 Tax=Solirubrobacter phytolaccae TaxID=1404360 RepID=A0A9X3N4A3_9ACTN|nr:hypothetical protein [Solirubrobacter phytolaccae]MDA0179236.1 hypothetical protein [Solirubrobacter phytolaccae]
MPWDEDQILLGGFPASLRDDVLSVLRALPPRTYPAMERREAVHVSGEEVAVPYRIHYPELEADTLVAMSDGQQLVAGCLYSRHGDGHVRERAIARVVDSTEPWVIPYVLSLLGEYVFQICALVHEEAPLTSPAYQDFARANRQFLALTENRANSYWGEYHRFRYPRRREYPALLALDQLRGCPDAEDAMLK